ncbi:hypothetical protein PAPYR_4600 [Paratrimastix pyriformis]|uniref:Uncharacterized protein n=1 Tax=Paratrimastix pyriformis TaxID=342808 RepID=A0ABQ8UJX4_9EUKA|nr:hypothetical protein PAPYR_4600 [Paratrimastix pyriformis]
MRMRCIVHAPLDNSAQIVSLLEDFPVEPILVVSQLPGGCFLLSLVPLLPLSFCFGFAPDPPLDCADPPRTLPCVWCADIDSVAALFRKVRPSVIGASPPPAGPSAPGPKRWRGMAMHCAPAHRELLLRDLPGARPRLLLSDDLLQEMGTHFPSPLAVLCKARGLCTLLPDETGPLVQIRGQNEAVALVWAGASLETDLRGETRIAELVPGPVDEELIPTPSNDRSLPSGRAPDDWDSSTTDLVHPPRAPPPATALAASSAIPRDLMAASARRRASPSPPPPLSRHQRPLSLDTGRPQDRSATLSPSDRPTVHEQPLPLLPLRLPASPHHAHEQPLPLPRRPLPLSASPHLVHEQPRPHAAPRPLPRDAGRPHDPPAIHIPPDPPARVIGLKHRREPALPPHNPLAAPPFPDNLLTPTSQQLPLPADEQRGHLRRRPNM